VIYVKSRACTISSQYEELYRAMFYFNSSSTEKISNECLFSKNQILKSIIYYDVTTIYYDVGHITEHLVTRCYQYIEWRGKSRNDDIYIEQRSMFGKHTKSSVNKEVKIKFQLTANTSSE